MQKFTFQRDTIVKPGWDDINALCRHPTMGNHGIHGNEIEHVLRTELFDGRAVAAIISVFTDKVPDTVPADWGPRRCPRTVGLSIHVQTITSPAPSCTYIGGLPCEEAYETAGGADHLQAALIDVPVYDRNAPHTDLHYLAAKSPGERFWTAYENLVTELLCNVRNFPQPDESTALRDIRTRHEQAHENFRAATTALHEASNALDDARLRYLKNDPAYRLKP